MAIQLPPPPNAVYRDIKELSREYDNLQETQEVGTSEKYILKWTKFKDTLSLLVSAEGLFVSEITPDLLSQLINQVDEGSINEFNIRFYDEQEAKLFLSVQQERDGSWHISGFEAGDQRGLTKGQAIDFVNNDAQEILEKLPKGVGYSISLDDGRGIESLEISETRIRWNLGPSHMWGEGVIHDILEEGSSAITNAALRTNDDFISGLFLVLIFPRADTTASYDPYMRNINDQQLYDILEVISSQEGYLAEVGLTYGEKADQSIEIHVDSHEITINDHNGKGNLQHYKNPALALAAIARIVGDSKQQGYVISIVSPNGEKYSLSYNAVVVHLFSYYEVPSFGVELVK